MNTLNAREPNQYRMLTGMIFVLLLLLLASLAGSSPVLNLFGQAKINGTIFFITRMIYWFILLLLWLYCSKMEKQPLLIWEEKNYPFLTCLASIIIIFLVLFAGLFIIQQILTATGLYKKSDKLSEIVNILRGNMPLLVFTALTAAVVEELIFRGYLQPRLEILFKNSYIPIILSALLFGLLHYRYGTFVNVIGPVFIGLVFACYYRKYRNIKVLIIAHFLWDIISLLSLVKASS